MMSKVMKYDMHNTQFESSALIKPQPSQPCMRQATYFWCIATRPVPIIQTVYEWGKSNRDLADSKSEVENLGACAFLP